MIMNKDVSKEGGLLLKEMRRFVRKYRIQMWNGMFNRLAILMIAVILYAGFYKGQVSDLTVYVLAFFGPVLCSAIICFLKPVRKTRLASRIDRQLGLKDRLLTSMNFMDSRETTAVLLFNDTLNSLKGADTAFLFPLKWKRSLLSVILLGCSLIFYQFHDGTVRTPSGSINGPAGLKLIMKKEGEGMKKLSRMLEKDLSSGAIMDDALPGKLEDLGYKLENGTIDKRDALLMLTDLSSYVENKAGERIDTVKSARHTDPRTHLSGDDPVRKQAVLRNIAESLKLSKRHIAEAGLAIDKEDERPGPERDSRAHGIGQREQRNRAASVSGGHPVTGAARGGEADGTSGSGTLENGEDGRAAETAGDRSEAYVYKNYDSVLPVESLPEKYHRLIIHYFDAISESRE
jgi:hypothetical protein